MFGGGKVTVSSSLARFVRDCIRFSIGDSPISSYRKQKDSAVEFGECAGTRYAEMFGMSEPTRLSREFSLSYSSSRHVSTMTL